MLSRYFAYEVKIVNILNEKSPLKIPNFNLHRNELRMLFYEIIEKEFIKQFETEWEYCFHRYIV